MLRSNRRVLCGIVVAVLLAGCGQSIGTSAVSPQSAGDARATSSAGPLLYVVRKNAHEISMLSLSDYRLVGKIGGFHNVSGICADASGNVWVTNYRHGGFSVDEFAHGGTQVISELRAPKNWHLNGCAVDPTSGNLAAFGSDNYGGAWVLVWPGAQKGKPAQYQALCCAPISAVYDTNGNLYVSGAPGGDDWYLIFGELAKGSAKFVYVKLDKPTYEPGAVQWDGTYVVVATALSKRTRNAPRLYRLQINGKSGHVVQVIEPESLAGDYGGGWSGSAVLFALYGGTAIGVASTNHERFLAAWAYPNGGAITATVARYGDVGGLAVSP
jgi:hypothetical protein